MKNLKFEVGKYYRTRNGDKVICLTNTLRGPYKIMFQLNEDTFTTTITGENWAGCSNKPKDIISEWVEKVIVDWSAMPAWAEFAAMNADGTWYWYTNEPKFENGFWNANFKKGNIPVKYAPEFKGKAEYSLTKKTN